MSNHRKIWEECNNEKIEKGMIIHHINLNDNDNNIENLWKCDNKDHRSVHSSIYKISKRLIKKAFENKIITFDKITGTYHLNPFFDVIYNSEY